MINKRDITVSRFGPVLRQTTALFFLFLFAVKSFAFAGEPFGGRNTQLLQYGITPEQAAAARQYIGSDPESYRQALDNVLKERAGEAQGDAVMREPAAGRPEANTIAGVGRGTAESPYDWRKSTYVGGLFSNRLTARERESLVHFGHDLFVPFGAATPQSENLPVSSNYVVGPGDELIVRMWGRVEGTQRMVVDRDGKIFFPKFGSIYVAGKTFEEVKKLLKSKVSTIAEVNSDVGMGQMKGIRVSVMGEVRNPGWYNISSLNTAIQALSSAGRLKDIGSLRRISILRGSSVVGEIDLYDFLLKGDSRSDIRLIQGDVVFVPVVGRLAAVAGEVRRPAIYELKGGENLLDLVHLAGGFTPAAYKRRVQVERLEENTARVVLDADADELEKNQDGFALADGDLVRVFPIILADEKAVALEGNVRRPGRYEFKDGMTVGSLFNNESEFLPETHYEYALIVRLVPPDLRKEIVPVNLREIVLERKRGADVTLMPRDTLRVFHRKDFEDFPRASISGEIRLARVELLKKPVADDGTRFSFEPEKSKEERFRESLREEDHIRRDDMVKSADGVGEKAKADALAESREAILRDQRIRRRDFKASEIREAELRFAETRGADTRAVDARRAESHFERNALVFEIHEGTRVADLVNMAGGLTRLASLERAEIVRVDESRNYQTIYFHLGKAMAGDPQENKLLHDEDRIRIHSIHEASLRRTVSVAGEVRQPGDFILTRDMKLSDLLFKSGGFLESSYQKEAELIRREISEEGDFVSTRTIIVYPDRAVAGEEEADIPLVADDFLYVRQIPEWEEKILITLAGEFRFPGAYAAQKGERLSSVIRRAGGYTNGAYIKAAVFTRVSTQEAQQEAIDKMIEELEIAVAEKAQEVGAALSREDVESNRQLLEARRGLLAQLKKVKAQGRVIIKLSDPDAMVGSSDDIFLEDGDRLFVPTKMNVVNVVGRVYNPTGVVYDPANDSVSHYLKKVGGPADKADRDNIFVLKANGSVVSRSSAGGNFLTGGFMSSKIEPGDSIVVPQKLAEARAMKDVKDLVQILYQIAVSVGVLVIAF
ncbi:MAG: SLBB domain-containing protein [Syntrophorhabdaceae bacterium]|nr:SLBB domain-containing protein [Syntrophorhabdaceae bacterium]